MEEDFENYELRKCLNPECKKFTRKGYCSYLCHQTAMFKKALNETE